ncbi:hypothetical protein QN277_006302 [Acacia crassicarpa]|uniref:H15 domain-containing protein n=1 Tax=Acacia crassicarpa TaxID=499986 RepID=A0AAE1MBL2_9FABA|nr:hypothetical protein QN277_006302 [Acacia crassicarpa]
MDPSSSVPASAPPADAPANPPSEDKLSIDDKICIAIAALGNANGSSKIAIAKYLEDTYADDLPPNPNDLLAERLKVMTRERRLVLVKRSYQLPDSPSSSSRKRGRPCKKRKLDELPPDVPLVDNAQETRGRPLNIQEAITAVPVSIAPPPDSPVPAYALPPSRASPQAVGAGTSGGVRPPQDSPGSAAGRSKKVTPVKEELRRKLKHFQSKVKQSTREIKSHLPIESLVQLHVPIKELEELAKMDLDGPLPNETQEQPPQQ